MRRRTWMLLGVLVGLVEGCGVTDHSKIAFEGCTDEWFSYMEEQVPTDDGQGHGPDPGSSEWRSVIEFRLGIRDDPSVPPIESRQWCRYVDDRI
jgi:hypothetical protein